MMFLFLLSAVSAFTSVEYESHFGAFLKEHKKVYEGDEVLYRFGIFKKTLDAITSHNAANKSWTEGINRFSDLTEEEFSRTMLGYLERKRNPVEEVLSTSVGADIDWVSKGAVTPVKDQGQCGSCWAFSTTGGMEGAHYVSASELLSLSEQQLVDCSGSFGNQGCNGGLMDNAFKYAEKTALALEADYKYTARKGTCKTVTGKIKVTGYTDVGHSESALAAALAKQPVSIAVDARTWQKYSGGLYSGCASKVSLDHGVLLVGSTGTSEWKVKNSWGAGWGESGFIRLVQGSNECGLTNAASVPQC
jgi:cathepsin L